MDQLGNFAEVLAHSLVVAATIALLVFLTQTCCGLVALPSEPVEGVFHLTGGQSDEVSCEC